METEKELQIKYFIHEMHDMITDHQYIDNTPLDAERVKEKLLKESEEIIKKYANILFEIGNRLGYQEGYNDGCYECVGG